MAHRRTTRVAAACGLVGIGLVVASSRDPDLWSSPDQRADRLFRRGEFADAAKTYRDPYRRGVALYRAKEFKEAATTFATVATPEASFDQGNALVMAGKYADAVAAYDRALSLRLDWPEAADNRAVAVVRRDRLVQTGGVGTEGQLEADAIVFEKGKKPADGKLTELAAGEPLSDDALRGLWLRRVQTKPADFLRAKFAFQAQEAEGRTP